MCKKHTVPIDKNNNLGQSKSLPTMCILPLRRRRFAYFECTSHTLIHLFYIHAWHRMIEAARRGRDKNDVLQCAMVSQFGHSLNVVTSSSRGSSNQPISFLKLRRNMALRVAEALCATGRGGINCIYYTGAVRPQKGL